MKVRFHHIDNLFPILNEFHKPEPTIQTDLNTNGGELYYSDGIEYIGSYHIHPTIGPMEGATHTENPHKKLYYNSELPKIDGNLYEDFINSQKESLENEYSPDTQGETQSSSERSTSTQTSSTRGGGY